jgi:lysyl-tRNA synthetase class 1
MVSQVARFDLDRVMEILDRTGYPGVSRTAVAERLEYASHWLLEFAPEEEKFTVQERLPDEAAGLTDDQRRLLSGLAEGLTDTMDGAAVHDLIYHIAGGFEETPPAELFQAIYLSLLGKARGPRAGSFIAILGSGFCAGRFAEAAG